MLDTLQYSTVFVDEEADVFQPEVDHGLRFVGDERSEVSAHYHVPAALELLLHFVLDEESHVLVVLQLPVMLLLVRFSTELNGCQSPIFSHVTKVNSWVYRIEVLVFGLRNLCHFKFKVLFI